MFPADEDFARTLSHMEKRKANHKVPLNVSDDDPVFLRVEDVFVQKTNFVAKEPSCKREIVKLHEKVRMNQGSSKSVKQVFLFVFLFI